MSLRKANAQRGSESLIAGLIPQARALTVAGEINDQMVAELTLPILSCRSVVEVPFGVLVDSGGGQVDSFAKLLDLLGASEGPPRRPSLITLATSEAASAAARLVVAGTIAAALPEAQFLFHGVWKQPNEVTEKGAAELGADLHEANDRDAKWLARRVFPRMMDTFARVAGEFAAVEKTAAAFVACLGAAHDTRYAGLGHLAAVLFRELPDRVREIIPDALVQVAGLRSLKAQLESKSDSIPDVLREALARRRREARRVLEHDARVLTYLLAEWIADETHVHLRSQDLLHIALDFDYYIEWTSKAWQDDLLFVTAEHASAFSSKKELRELRRLAKKGDANTTKDIKRFDRLLERAYDRAAPVWAFSLAISRMLHSGDLPLDAASAWWLGLLDVVVGSSLDRRQPISVRPRWVSEQDPRLHLARRFR
jgi:ATP-dependent protease ClpP protease subunit